ncbi:hypothetical protein CR66_05445 [Campylobacter mucosalis]|uniref:hypothetical protein n=1 Tax=Campylobacter mucosalis TaxID=202 RepID=UPI0004D9E822|nr:hypothetical protein [Campylobacter mucosalis]KEA45846.1 hypothetical protein CR66_05445 [Campylobacter mucosalis]QKF62378.1 hypothetical protein CMCT_0209 [Campylobacter mucosalis]
MTGTMIITDETPQIRKILQNAIDEIRQLTPQVKVEYIDYDQGYISEADADILRQIVQKDNRGEIEYISAEEFQAKMHQRGFAW